MKVRKLHGGELTLTGGGAAHLLPPQEGVSSLADWGRQGAIRGTEGGDGGGKGGEGDDGGLNDGGVKGGGGQQVLEEAAVAVATQLSWRPDSAKQRREGVRSRGEDEERRRSSR